MKNIKSTTNTISVFNLINIFRRSRSSVQEKLIAITDCDTHFHHDFYCDIEKPFISIQ